MSPCLQTQCPPTYSYICPSAPLYNLQCSKCVITHLQRKICSAQVSQATTRVSGTRQSQKGEGKGEEPRGEPSCRVGTADQFAPPPHLPEQPPLPIQQKGGWGQFAPADKPRICKYADRGHTWSSKQHLHLEVEETNSLDTCPGCCCSKSHESFTNCQSLKSDNSSHLLCFSRCGNRLGRAMHLHSQVPRQAGNLSGTFTGSRPPDPKSGPPGAPLQNP